MIRILHVFGKLDRGGAETMIMNLYRNINRRKIQFDFVVHTDDVGDYEPEILKLGGKIYRIPKYKGTNHFQYVQVWKKLLDQHPEYEIIHGHVRSTASIYLYVAKQKGRITISHSHSTTSGKGFSSNVKNLLQKPIRYIADYLVAPSYEAAVWLFGNKVIKKSNFFIIKNSIDAKKYVYNEQVRTKIRKELSIDDKFVIGHVGRFHQLKNHEFLIDVFYKVLKEQKNSILLLIGEGDLYSELRKKVQKLGIDEQVIFLGKKENVYDYYQVIDIFVFPSHFEGLGLVAIEAQASGLKTIVSTQIPKEAFVTDLIHSLSLKLPAKRWAEIILKNQNYKRKDTFSDILAHHYDINDNSHFIQEFYYKLLLDNERNLE